MLGKCSALRVLLPLIALLALCGCRVVEPRLAGKSPLIPLGTSADSIALEVFSAPAPTVEGELEELWQHVDEQPLPADLRKRLADNGFRAGLAGPNVPAALSKLLNATGKRVVEEDKQNVPVDVDAGIILRVLHPQPGKRIDVTLPHTKAEMTLLERVEGEVRGKNYDKPECRLALRVFPEQAGRVRLELIPELHYGEFKSHVRGSDGMMMWTQDRPKKSFTDLKLEPVLSAGQMFVVTRQPDQPTSAGHHFFTNTSGDKPVQMIWIFRLARSASDPAFFDPPSAKDLAEVTNDQTE